MNGYLFLAGLLALIVGLIHSVMGEARIFSRLRKDGFIPSEGGSLLKESHVRILWASWHALTMFGWGFAALLFWLSLSTNGSAPKAVVGNMVIASMVASSMLVLIGTKGRHPGWLGLLGVAVFTWLGLRG